MLTSERQSIDEIRVQMEEAGYRSGPPNQLVGEIDGQIIKEAQCGECAHGGLDFHAWHRRPTDFPARSVGSSYVAYAVCPVCGEVEEF